MVLQSTTGTYALERDKHRTERIREGRFDQSLYLATPKTSTSRVRILGSESNEVEEVEAKEEDEEEEGGEEEMMLLLDLSCLSHVVHV